MCIATGELRPSSDSVSPSGRRSPSVSQLCDALAQIDASPDPVLAADIVAALGAAALPKLATHGELVSCLRSLARLRVQPSQEWLAEATWALANGGKGLGSLTLREMLDLTGALAAMRTMSAVLPAGQPFMRLLHSAWCPLLSRMGLQQLAQLATHLAQLQADGDSGMPMGALTGGREEELAAAFREAAAARLREARRTLYSIAQPCAAVYSMAPPRTALYSLASASGAPPSQSPSASPCGTLSPEKDPSIEAYTCRAALPMLLSSLATIFPAGPRDGHDELWVELWATSGALLAGGGAGSGADTANSSMLMGGSASSRDDTPDTSAGSGGDTASMLTGGDAGSGDGTTNCNSTLVLLADSAAEIYTSRRVSPPGGWLRRLALAVERQAPTLVPEHVVALARSLAILGVQRYAGHLTTKPGSGAGSGSPPPLAAFGSHLAAVLPELGPAQLSAVCRFLPRLALPRNSWLSAALSEAAWGCMDRMGPSGLPTLACALADNNCMSAEGSRAASSFSGGGGARGGLMQGLMAASYACMARMDAGELAMLVACMARMRCQPTRPWMGRWGRAGNTSCTGTYSLGYVWVTIRSLPSSSPSASSPAHSLLPMPPYIPPRILPLLLHKLPQMPPASLSRTAWALARFGCRPSAEWWNTFMTEVAGRMSCFEAR